MTPSKPLALWTRRELLGAQVDVDKSKMMTDPSLLAIYLEIQDELNRRPTGVFSNEDILVAMERGQIVIDPFMPERLSTTSYDVSLGPDYFVCEGSRHMADFNPHDPKHVERYYRGDDKREGAYTAETHQAWVDEHRDGVLWVGIPPDALIIVLRPHEMILGHTVECIGARYEATTMMHAKSTVGRRNISACDDAGWGDIGYIGYWTLEIRNKNSVHVPLVVGQPLAQVIFLAAGNTERNYGNEGSYQKGTELEEVVSNWGRARMVPSTKLAPFVPVNLVVTTRN